MSRSVLILGASSPIARATAVAFAQKGYALYLAGRDINDLERIGEDLKIRFQVPVKWGIFNALAYESHASFIQNVSKVMDGLEGVYVGFGMVGDQSKGVVDFNEAHRIIQANYVGAVSALTHAANLLGKSQKGFIVGISSVAGDRGRQSNYIYGSAKAGLTTFLQGLRNRMFPMGVHVLTVKPGFVDTAMTYGKEGVILNAAPEKIGKAIVKAVEKRKNVVYLPWFWRIIMGIVKAIPEPLFKRLRM